MVADHQGGRHQGRIGFVGKGPAMKLFHRRQLLHLAAGAAVLPAVSHMANAQAYPTRPVRIVVGFPAGGTADIISRLMGQWLSERLGQQFIVENRPGAASNIAAEAVVRAPPDGYTLLMVTNDNAINSLLYQKLSFDVVRDIMPVVGLIHVPLVLEVHPAVLAKTVPELIAYARTNPGRLNLASYGTGSVSHLAGELFKMTVGVNMIHVPYRGSAPMLNDLLGGQVHVAFDALPASIEHVRAGRLRALAVTSTTRSPALPDIPTLGDFVAGYDAGAMNGIGVPRNTPPQIIGRLNEEINGVLALATVKARIADFGATVFGGPPNDLGNLLARETEKWSKVVQAANIKVE
jgi:tripartite-type tricarboxylate transporter receptor subunit TctC